MNRLSGPLNRYSKSAGWLGVFVAVVALLLYVINPGWGFYVSIALIPALGLLLLSLIVHFEALKAFSSRRSTKSGLNSLRMVVLVGLILSILNFISWRHPFRIDFSETRSFSLAPQTLKVLENLDRDVQIRAFFSEQAQARSRIKDLLGNYAYHSPKISYTIIDPDRKPSLAKQYEITEYDTLVFESGNQETRVQAASEQEITNAIIRINKDQKKLILFLEDHGEHSPADPDKNGYSLVKDQLQKQGFDVDALSLLEVGRVPEEANLLIIAGPQKKFLPQERKALSDYLSGGGRVFLLLDPNNSSGLDDLLDRWGVQMGKGLIIDTLSRLLGGDYTIPVVSQYPNHEITRNFNLATFFPVSQTVNFDQSKSSEFDFQAIAQTSENSWSKTNPRQGNLNFNPAEDVQGPLTLAAVITRKPSSDNPRAEDSLAIEGRDTVLDAEAAQEDQSILVVFGDSDFASNASFDFSGNGDFFLNTVNWLTEEKDLISIRPQQPHFTPLFLTRSQGKVLMILSLFLLPSVVILTGLTIWRKRRSL